MNLDRRQAMGKIVGFAGAAAVSPAVFAADTCPVDGAIGLGSDGGADLGANLLAYVELDPFEVAKRAYEGYVRGGCMYGVFNAVVKELAAQGHEDACNFAAIPTNITVYGGSGVKGWGSICGCVNAAAMIVNILGGVDQVAVIGAINRYYEKTPMPRGDDKFMNYIGAPIFHNDAGELLTPDMIGQSTADSILCHTSVSHWSAASKYGGAHKAKYERCAQVTAEVAFKTVEFLNQALKGELTTDPELEMVAKGNDDCYGCHTGTKREPDTYIGSDVNSFMECQTCHAPHDVTSGLTGMHADATCSTCHN
ncbi:cytochrome c, putative [Shewanella sediminis HAW-EB3]|uniref:Cytochrome c, putative n=1 Tax=Shewanella sediminis (strain HAW-EB3) TaxID=425104 RepID=A8FQK3_SHESH|nr:C-GCAxxG-C-C family protein [Shewanella sediminis]ABV35126.1 cytochrome c, putative [Shewanella sediminis HAW-EB3]